ncbi:MAG TPA: ROK family protein, partial [Firmicutes bacterium]|nr:ROK family protein [Bacillota bacterium]
MSGKSKHKRIALGIDIGGTKILAGLVAEDGRIIDQEVVPTAPLARPNAAEQLTGLAKRLADRNGLELGTLAGIGIGVPGVIDPESGMIVSCPNTKGLEGLVLGAHMESLTGLSTRVENDVNLAAWGEHWLYLPEVQNMVFMALGTGLGCGLVLNGRLYRGTGAAGEMGHMVIEREGPLCGCGKRGCFEALASGKAIAGTYRALCAESLPGGSENRGCEVSTEEVFARAEAGDTIARRVIEQTLTYLSLCAVNVANLLAPEVIVIGG